VDVSHAFTGRPHSDAYPDSRRRAAVADENSFEPAEEKERRLSDNVDQR
jgi:hypothetical protein